MSVIYIYYEIVQKVHNKKKMKKDKEKIKTQNKNTFKTTAAFALRLNSRAGTADSTVSSLNCDRWLILGLEALSH